MIPTHSTVAYRATPVVTWGVMGLCVVAFLYQMTLSTPDLQRFIEAHALVPARYVDPTWAAARNASRFDLSPFVTSMFLHGGFLHIASNLWTLWIFGPALEDRLGVYRYVSLYVGAGLVAGLAHFAFNFNSAVPALGASGAIAGIVGAYARRFPYAWVNVLAPIGLLPLFFFMPALMFAGLWFASQTFNAAGALLAPTSGAGIAWFAHIGGFLVGWFAVQRISPTADPRAEAEAASQSILWPWTTWWRWMTWWWRR